ncbi:extracellular solute-binding protein [Streptomyces katsurahamanus]|uniref:Extracellular solute-binding protein n=1 Tax=Streptomyces katsurahamanus TaxID=2577098 RepID=A0ABW9NN83_9ACTN|nr:extracellular solute-binding protein [Streptomyces katsurahamanus]
MRPCCRAAASSPAVPDTAVTAGVSDLPRIEPARPGVTVIEAWLSEFPFPGFLDAVRERAAEFERTHPRYRIVIRGFSYEKLPAKVVRAAASGSAPAIASYYSGASQLARDTRTADGAPLFVSVEKAIGGRSEILGEPVVIDDVLAGVREYYTYDGDLASMPMTLSTMLLYANTTLLERAGVPRTPRSWDEVELACKAVAGLPDGPAHGIAWPVDGKFMQHALAQQGGLLTDASNGHAGRSLRVDLTSPELLAYVRWWQRLHQEGHYLHTGVMEDWAGTFGALAGQRVALRFSSSFDANYMVRAAQDAGFGLEVGPLPHNDTVPWAGNWIGGDSLWLADGLDEATRDGALAFMQYLSSPLNIARRHKASGSAPVTGASVALLEEEGWFDEHPHHRVPVEQLALRGGPPSAHGALAGGLHGIQMEMMAAMEDVLTQGAPAGERFARAEAEAQRILDEYNAWALGTGPLTPETLAVRI